MVFQRLRGRRERRKEGGGERAGEVVARKGQKKKRHGIRLGVITAIGKKGSGYDVLYALLVEAKVARLKIPGIYITNR